MATINLTSITVDDTELWQAIMGAGWETWDWWQRVTYAVGTDWDTPGKVLVVSSDPDDDSGQYVAKTVTVDDLAAAVGVAHAKGYTRCGYPVNWLDMDDYDAMSADTVMQIAVLGDVVYG